MSAARVGFHEPRYFMARHGADSGTPLGVSSTVNKKEFAMKKMIRPADAYRTAQAIEMIKAFQNGTKWPCDAEGKIVPSKDALKEVWRDYIVTDDVPPTDTRPDKR